jgi:nucleoside-diphosphate-sugar epimerase
MQSWYPVAKIISEEAALDYGHRTRLDVVTVNPGLVFGPLLQPTVNASSQFLIYLLKGLSMHHHSAQQLNQKNKFMRYHCSFFLTHVTRELIFEH